MLRAVALGVSCLEKRLS